MTTDEIKGVIIGAINSISPDLENLSDHSVLLGSHGVVDSVGFVSLLVTLEEQLNGGIDLASVFMDEGSHSGSNPFETIETLTNYIHSELKNN